MMVGGIVEPGAGTAGAVVAYVVVSGGLDASRLFKVDGAASEPRVTELEGATTIDLSRFERDAQNELYPALRASHASGGHAAIAQPSAAWVCGVVKAHLKRVEGVDVE